jgi:hypothetical protein
MREKNSLSLRNNKDTEHVLVPYYLHRRLSFDHDVTITHATSHTGLAPIPTPPPHKPQSSL